MRQEVHECGYTKGYTFAVVALHNWKIETANIAFAKQQWLISFYGKVN